ncbi:hypothetical protein Bca101_022367 [Brassica carinata]
MAFASSSAISSFLCHSRSKEPIFSSKSSSSVLTGRRAFGSIRAAQVSPRRRSQNVEGDIFVDSTCIDCDTCRWMVPVRSFSSKPVKSTGLVGPLVVLWKALFSALSSQEVFTRVDNMSAVIKQPTCKEERLNALQALLSCPTGSIRTETPPTDIGEAQETFPLALDEDKLPDKLLHCSGMMLRITRNGQNDSSVPEFCTLEIASPARERRKIDQSGFQLGDTGKKAANLQMMASGKTPGLTQEANDCTFEATVDRDDNNNTDVFDVMKQRFLDFKKLKYMDNLEHYKNLADAQAPKSGPTETKAALQFSVNTLEVENILVIGHSRCGGIQALMSMEGEGDSRNFIHNWVVVGKKAKESTKAVASNLHFDHQCQHCEKTSINHSLERLLGYPWIEEKVRKGSLSLHGGYYDFVNCTFEKWTVDYGGKKEDGGIAVKNRSVW